MNIKVLHFLDSINRGGTETQALDVARRAGVHGLDLTLVTAGGGALESEFRDQNFEFICTTRRLPVDLFLASRLRKIIRDRRIQLVRGHQAVDGLHLYLATRGFKDVKRAMSIEGFVPDKKNRQALKFLLPKMDANIYVSRSLKEWLAKKDGLDTSLNSTVIFNCVDPKRLEASGLSVRREIGARDAAIVLGMVGNFYRDPRKDHLTLVRALPRVFSEFREARCLIAGGVEPGAEEKYAACREFCESSGIADRVHFLGSRGDVPNILAALDIFVFSSLHEGLPIAILEAMFARVPVVASDIAPHLELSENGEFAVMFKTGEANDLACKILMLLRSDESRQELTRRAYRHAMDNFSVDAHLGKVRKLYDKLLSS